MNMISTTSNHLIDSCFSIITYIFHHPHDIVKCLVWTIKSDSEETSLKEENSNNNNNNTSNNTSNNSSTTTTTTDSPTSSSKQPKKVRTRNLFVFPLDKLENINRFGVMGYYQFNSNNNNNKNSNSTNNKKEKNTTTATTATVYYPFYNNIQCLKGKRGNELRMEVILPSNIITKNSNSNNNSINSNNNNNNSPTPNPKSSSNNNNNNNSSETKMYQLLFGFRDENGNHDTTKACYLSSPFIPVMEGKKEAIRTAQVNLLIHWLGDQVIFPLHDIISFFHFLNLMYSIPYIYIT